MALDKPLITVYNINIYIYVYVIYSYRCLKVYTLFESHFKQLYPYCDI